MSAKQILRKYGTTPDLYIDIYDRCAKFRGLNLKQLSLSQSAARAEVAS
jgi:hypothetical protein